MIILQGNVFVRAKVIAVCVHPIRSSADGASWLPTALTNLNHSAGKQNLQSSRSTNTSSRSLRMRLAAPSRLLLLAALVSDCNCIIARIGTPSENWVFRSFCESAASLVGKCQPGFEGTLILPLCTIKRRGFVLITSSQAGVVNAL